MNETGSSHAPIERSRSDGSSAVTQTFGPSDLGAPVARPPVDVRSGGDDRTQIRREPAALPGASRPVAPIELGRMLVGQRLGHFELLDFVGGGGMGAVFRARDTMLNREVAVKVRSRDQGADEETRRRFQNEAQSAARLDHENIARVYYVGEDRGLNYIVFEFIEGVNL
ncbi:MAG TPA: protein kinase, partial [Pirellulales bacterium]|nr:protein kinase [Pirellulales bacterium]